MTAADTVGNTARRLARPSIPIAGSASAVALEIGGSRTRLASRDRRNHTTTGRRRKIVVRIAGPVERLIVGRTVGPVERLIVGRTVGPVERLIVGRTVSLVGGLIVGRTVSLVGGPIVARTAGPVEQVTTVAEEVTDARPKRTTRPPGARGPAVSRSCRRPRTPILDCSTPQYVPNCAHSAS
jgi:hypothetical protein